MARPHKKNARRGALQRLKEVSVTVKVLVPVLTLVGMIVATMWGLDLRYASAADTEAKFRQVQGQIQQSNTEVKALILEGRREQLVRDRLELESRSALSAGDRTRLGLIKDQIDRLDKQIERLQRPLEDKK